MLKTEPSKCQQLIPSDLFRPQNFDTIYGSAFLFQGLMNRLNLTQLTEQSDYPVPNN